MHNWLELVGEHGQRVELVQSAWGECAQLAWKETSSTGRGINNDWEAHEQASMHLYYQYV